MKNNYKSHIKYVKNFLLCNITLSLFYSMDYKSTPDFLGMLL